MEQTLQGIDARNIDIVFGSCDTNLEILENELNVKIFNRNSEINVKGESDDVSVAVRALNSLFELANSQDEIRTQTVRYAIQLAKDNAQQGLAGALNDSIFITSSGKPIKPKTIAQKRYVDAIINNVVTFGIGPAGTGKTYLATALAVSALKNKQVMRIVLTRPAVEAGESLGFLPGDLQEKVDPYLRPLYDALFDMLGPSTFSKYMEKGIIEIAPLAYMRGRTLENSFIILDEAQNTSCEQMKMFLTRFGPNSKIVVTGDITQIDLPKGKKSGLVDAVETLKNIDLIAIHRFEKKDIVRHELVGRIVKAYELKEKKKEGR